MVPTNVRGTGINLIRKVDYMNKILKYIEGQKTRINGKIYRVLGLKYCIHHYKNVNYLYINLT